MRERHTLFATTLLVGLAGFVPYAHAQSEGARGDAVAVSREQAGRIEGIVTDERGLPLRGAAVTAHGTATAFAVTDNSGRFVVAELPPGAYLVAARLSGFAASRRTMVHVGANRATYHKFTLTPAIVATSGRQTQVILAGGTLDLAEPSVPSHDEDEAGAPVVDTEHDHSSTAWRLRHLKRSVLRDTTDRVTAIAGMPIERTPETDDSGFDGARPGGGLAAALISHFPVSAQVRWLTTTAFDSPEDLFRPGPGSRGVAYVSIGSTPGSPSTWEVEGALTQGDVSSWVLAGSYHAQPVPGHTVDAGISYAMQRYEGGNPAALAAMAGGSRNVGTVHAFDRWAIGDRAEIGYGAHYARYDYVMGEGLLSPSFEVRISPVKQTWVRATITRQMIAPGAQEFVPTPSAALWLPPQRTFASLDEGFQAERTRHVEIAVEQEAGAFLLGVRHFRQGVTDQIVTLFGLQMPGRSHTDLGHYYTAAAGSFDAEGWAIRVSRPAGSRVRGGVEYSVTSATWHSGPGGVVARLSPSSQRRPVERTHDVTAVVEAEMPETATRVYTVYRVNTGYTAAVGTTPTLDARFDVQVHQGLPFLGFTGADWQLLFAVRNLFHDRVIGGSVYDELLVLNPPKRVIGGLTVRF